MASRSRSYSARYVAAMKRRNRIYLAIVIVKALTIAVLSITHGGFDCG